MVLSRVKFEDLIPPDYGILAFGAKKDKMEENLWELYALLSIMKDNFSDNGVNPDKVHITSVYRDAERLAKIYKRPTQDAILGMYAGKTWVSRHCWGLAADLVSVDPKVKSNILWDVTKKVADKGRFAEIHHEKDISVLHISALWKGESTQGRPRVLEIGGNPQMGWKT